MKNIRKLVALVLTLTLLMSALPLAFAKNVSYKQDCPYIYIHGFDANTIYDNPTSPDPKALFPPTTEAIIGAVATCAPALGAYLINGNKTAFERVIGPALKKLFGDFILDRDGNVIEKSGIIFDPTPDPSKITASSRLKFGYDWRLDPMDIADELNDYINYVCDASGCDKVGIMAHSCGSIIALAYVTKYGTDKIKGIVMNSAALNGETYTGELMTGDMKIDMDAVDAFLGYILNESDYKTVVNGAASLLTGAGILDSVEDLGNRIIDDFYDVIMESAIFPMFAYMPTIWAMIPDEYMEASLDFAFNGKYADKDYDYSVMKARIADYNTNVRDNRAALLTSLEENGHFGVLARYGFSSIPLTSSWKNLSDGIIDTKLSSFGATTALYGETLSEEYIATVDAKYISPDRTVDASTCMFPEKTWFVKNYGHTDSNLLPELTYAILYADEEVTVDTYEAYPRFIIYNEEGEFVPQKENDTKSPFEKLKAFFKQIADFFRNLFAKLKG